MSPDSSNPEYPRGTLFSPLLEAAVRLAARGHYHQFRKNAADENSGAPSGDFLPDRVPYIAHLMGTMCILARVGVRDEVLAAAILHDYLEDVPDPDGQESIRAALGEEVLSLVLEVTEHKRRGVDEVDTWEIRKQEQIDHIDGMPHEAVLIKAADVLHNLLALLSDLEAAEDPDSVWRPFNAGPERQLWYFTGVIDAIARRLGEHLLVKGLQEAVGQLQPFVSS
jgi:(p)ppGpp synthase/HD superfamily hydrolase